MQRFKTTISYLQHLLLTHAIEIRIVAISNGFVSRAAPQLDRLIDVPCYILVVAHFDLLQLVFSLTL